MELLYVLIAVGILFLVVGIYELRPKKVTIDDTGIKIERGGKEVFTARWDKLKSISADHYFNSTGFIPTSGTFAIRTSKGILLEKQDSKYKLLESCYEKGKLKEAFEFMAGKLSRSGIHIVDNLDWIDESRYDDLSISSGQIKSTKEKRLDIVVRVGEVLLAVGVVFSAITYFFEVLEIFMIVGIMGLFFGIFITVIGLAGKSELD